MPELRFVVRWPDGARESCYSPSTIIRDHFQSGKVYSMAEFLSRSRTALAAASDRVKAIRGAPCWLALHQLARIEAAGVRYPSNTHVVFESFEE